MALSIPYAFSGQLVGSTEVDLTNNTTVLEVRTTLGVYGLFLDINALTLTERYVLRIYEKASSGSSLRVLEQVPVVFNPVKKLFTPPPLFLAYGWTFTLTKLQGTDRVFSWSIRMVG
jgi:hypothetical protein